MYKTILVPLDGSKRAERILPHVEEMALYNEADVFFLQVIEPDHTYVGPHLAVSNAEFNKNQEKEAKEYLTAIRGEFREKGITARFFVERGPVVSRIIEIADLFRGGGFEIGFQTNIDAWLKYHVALVVPIAHAIYMAGGDNFKLAKTRDAIVLMVRGVREGFRVLQALNLPITPPNLKMFTWIPEPFMVAWASRMLDNELMELMLSQHANAAPDEMKFLADEFLHLGKQTNIATPALERLYIYSDPNSQPIDIGSAQIPLDWRPIWLGTGVLVSVMLSTLLILSRRKK